MTVERLINICQRYEEIGVTEISLADTTGMANPVLVKEVVSKLYEMKPNFHFSLHLHNTRGMALQMPLLDWKKELPTLIARLADLEVVPMLQMPAGTLLRKTSSMALKKWGYLRE